MTVNESSDSASKFTPQQEDHKFHLVSVIIPTFNYGHFVLASIDSVRRQDYPNIEIIVIDDGSTDNTQNILTRQKDIVYIHQTNQGLSAARNNGLLLAKGKYIQFLDSDDLLGITSIRERVEFLEKNPDKSFVACRSAFFHKRTLLPERHPFITKEWRQPKTGMIDIAFYYFNIAPPHAFLTRKSTIDKHGLWFDTKLHACEDYDFWFRLAQTAGLPGLLRSCWVYYRQHVDSMSRSYVNQYRHDAKLCQRILAASNNGEKWLGSRHSTDYFTAMFASAVLTARRLWRFDRPMFKNFMSDHILPLHQKLMELKQSSPASSAVLLYSALARLSILRMWGSEHSINQSVYRKLCYVLPSATSYATLAIMSKEVPLFSTIFIRLLKLDIIFIGFSIYYNHVAINRTQHVSPEDKSDRH